MQFRTTAFTTTLFALFALACESGETTSASSSSSSSASGASAPAAAADIGEVLAKVNNQNVGSNEFEEAASRKQPSEGDALSLSDKQEVLDKLVDEKLLYEAALVQGLDKDPKVMKVMVNTLLREEVYSNVRNSDFNDQELQAYYETHKEEFVVPEKVQIKRILIKITDDRPDADALAEASRIRKEVAADPKQFKDLAGKYSEDPYRRRGGDVGFVPKIGKPCLDPEIVDKAFAMDVEAVSEPFKTNEGYNIIYVANKRDRVERTFQQMKGSVLRKVKNEKLKGLYEDYVANLRQNADIQVNQDKLDLIDVKSAKRPAGPGFALNPSLKTEAPAPGDASPSPKSVEMSKGAPEPGK